MKLKFRTVAATAAVLLGTIGLAQAQSSTGNIQGMAAAGDTIVVDSAQSGFHREITIEDAGKFSMRRVPLGTYTVIQKHADGTMEQPRQIEVHTGVTVRIQ